EDQQKHLEQLILKVTVSCGWAFSWIENPEVKHKKVLAMCQLRSELLHSRNITAIDKLLKTYKQNISIPPENNEQISLEDSEEELSDDKNDIVEINLAEEEEDNYMQCDLFSLDESEILTNLYDEAMLQDDIHPTDNLAAKWKLANIFVDSL
ncbi:12802_t:CDS:2, partial [Gigaspora margarita]